MRVTAIVANCDELLSDALQRFFKSSFVEDLSKQVFSLDIEAMGALAANLHVTAAPSITAQSTLFHAYGTAEAI
jgi:hypothetical protein